MAQIFEVRDVSLLVGSAEKNSIHFMDFSAKSAQGPFLISGTRKLQWREHAGPGDLVRVALCGTDVLTEYAFLKSVLVRSEYSEWGTVFPMSPQGLQMAAQRLKSAGLGDLQILSSPSLVPELEPSGLPVEEIPNLQDQDWVAVVPQKVPLGYLGVVSSESAFFFSSNVSNRICFLRRFVVNK
jgi:hypothetical protein